MIKLKGKTFLLGSCWLLAIAFGCGPERHDVSGNGNSETHFLGLCTDSCGGGLTCVCGVCTQACASTLDCRSFGANAECAPACSDAPVENVCDVTCDADLDCSGLGADYVCRAGRCRYDGDTGGTGGGGSGPTVVTDVASFKLATFEALCTQIFQCPDASEDNMYFRAEAGTEQHCVEILTASPLYLAAQRDLDERVRAGTVELLLGQVPACLDALESCSLNGVTQPDTPACRDVFRGSSPLDGPCARAEDCANDARCVIDAECPGHCTPRAATGEPCERETDCDDRAGPAVCKLVDAGSQCARRTFTAPSALNGACTPVGYDTVEITPCPSGQHCEATDDTRDVGVCRDRVARDGACDSGAVCSDDQLCLSGVCQNLVIGRKAGDPCGAEGQGCDVFARLRCVDGACQLATDGTEGSRCLALDEAALAHCNQGLVCLDPASDVVAGPDGYRWGTCGKPRAAGETCVENDDCASQHCRGDSTCGAEYCCDRYSCQSN